MTDKKIKVLIVDDSNVSRELMQYIVQSDPQMTVVGMAENGVEALKLLQKTTPDVIMMDIVMPKMDGFELTRQIMSTKPIPIIVVSGIYNKNEMASCFKAIEAGALALLEKPKGIGDAQYKDTARFVIETIRSLSDVKLKIGKNVYKPGDQSTYTTRINIDTAPPVPQKIEAIAIGASIGGPQALCQLLSELPTNFPVPIYVVQHISAGFVAGFAEWLKESVKLKVTLAKTGMLGEPGTVYIAPDQFNMEVWPHNTIKLNKPKESEHFPPTIGSLFDSIAKNYGPKAVGIILSGMGKDGPKELLKMKEAGSLTIAQNEESSVKFDLPREAIRLNAARHIIPLTEIAPFLKKITKT
jgi:two-component system chemotaxis response regulator CheB